MRIFGLLLALALSPVSMIHAASAPPNGRVVEMHALEVYTGGCTASAQSTMGGRSMLRLWDFAGGEQDGVELRGLQVAALQVAGENLAAAETRPSSAVVYLPRAATADQRAALVRWLKTSNPDLAQLPLVEKVAEIKYSQEETRITLQVGEQIALKTRAIQKCDTGACGESLWYKPRTRMGEFTVVVNESSTVNEPALALVWKDNSAKSVFFGRFGPEAQPEFRLASIE